LRIRCGVDMIEIDRVARAYRRRPGHFMARFFTSAERELLSGRPHSAKHLAARFAAKEAVFKVLGRGVGAVSWREVEILAHPWGEPFVRLHGRAASRAAELALGDIAVSISHCRDYAIAQAVAICATKK